MEIFPAAPRRWCYPAGGTPESAGIAGMGGRSSSRWHKTSEVVPGGLQAGKLSCRRNPGVVPWTQFLGLEKGWKRAGKGLEKGWERAPELSTRLQLRCLCRELGCASFRG